MSKSRNKNNRNKKNLRQNIAARTTRRISRNPVLNGTADALTKLFREENYMGAHEQLIFSSGMAESTELQEFYMTDPHTLVIGFLNSDDPVEGDVSVVTDSAGKAAIAAAVEYFNEPVWLRNPESLPLVVETDFLNFFTSQLQSA